VLAIRHQVKVAAEGKAPDGQPAGSSGRFERRRQNPGQAIAAGLQKRKSAGAQKDTGAYGK
jgi:hypothetical protein